MSISSDFLLTFLTFLLTVLFLRTHLCEFAVCQTSFLLNEYDDDDDDIGNE